ncbi:hypothetical protein COO91_01891 [Nostoc flagelliforme CCNUN1]|uniref:Uncharacterized protein n=1 Tax=Nostoc flagelliforme CCNUN1 TaxID=2038116 RepID=A0A2K8SKS0_9NOSO|nr:hypothetical protein COO91_01891 [Nostoc flagelliforme CCNUN1]
MIYSLLSVVLLYLFINSLRPESFFTQLPTFQTSSKTRKALLTRL